MFAKAFSLKIIYFHLIRYIKLNLLLLLAEFNVYAALVVYISFANYFLRGIVDDR